VVSSTPANGDAEPGPGEVWLELDVYGMRCQGCATNLRLGLGEVDGVRQVDVDVPGEGSPLLAKRSCWTRRRCGPRSRSWAIA
jgi:hypothetical protein